MGLYAKYLHIEGFFRSLKIQIEPTDIIPVFITNPSWILIIQMDRIFLKKIASTRIHILWIPEKAKGE